MTAPTTRQLAVDCAKACDEKKAADIVVLDVRKQTIIADYFVICSATNERQARAISDALREAMRERGLRELGLEGVSDGKWVLQDFADVVVHIFHESQRAFYDLEGLWADAKKVRWQANPAKA
jgi:ribosome-associated protein